MKNKEMSPELHKRAGTDVYRFAWRNGFWTAIIIHSCVVALALLIWIWGME